MSIKTYRSMQQRDQKQNSHIHDELIMTKETILYYGGGRFFSLNGVKNLDSHMQGSEIVPLLLHHTLKLTQNE